MGFEEAGAASPVELEGAIELPIVGNVTITVSTAVEKLVVVHCAEASST